MKFKTFTVAAALALATSVASAALVQINETQLGLGTQVVNGVSKLNGGYNEVITIDPSGSFGAAGFASFGQYYDASNNAMSVLGGQTTLGASYGLFAVFNSTGMVTGPSTITGLAGSFTLYAIKGGTASANLDPASGYSTAGFNTTPGSVVYTLATSTNMSFGLGNGIGSEASAFKFVFDNMSLTSDGEKFFTDPNPFYMTVNVNGDIDDGLPSTTPGTYANALGDISAVFDDTKTVPEPSSLALVGFALAGLGLGRRRSKNAAK